MFETSSKVAPASNAPTSKSALIHAPISTSFAQPSIRSSVNESNWGRTVADKVERECDRFARRTKVGLRLRDRERLCRSRHQPRRAEVHPVPPSNAYSVCPLGDSLEAEDPVS
jgi:hypothetical protein